MSDVARELRRETLAAGRARTPQQRLELALRLGHSDVSLHRAGKALSEEDARLGLERQRRAGRRPSACAAGR